MKSETKIKAAETLTGKETEFTIIDNGKEYSLSMSGLKLQTLIDISAETEKLTLYSTQEDGAGSPKPFEIIRAMKTDAEINAKIIALAVINCKEANDTTKRIFPWFQKAIEPASMTLPKLTKFLLKTLDSDQLHTLSNLVKEKTGYTAFFLSTVSLKGINLLEKTAIQVTGQPAESGEE